MNALQLLRCMLLVLGATLAGAGNAQSTNVQELENYRLQLHEQVVGGKLTAKEAESLYMQKRSQLLPQVSDDQPPRDTARQGAGIPQLVCQTYPDGRTECR